MVTANRRGRVARRTSGGRAVAKESLEAQTCTNLQFRNFAQNKKQEVRLCDAEKAAVSGKEPGIFVSGKEPEIWTLYFSSLMEDTLNSPEKIFAMDDKLTACTLIITRM